MNKWKRIKIWFLLHWNLIKIAKGKHILDFIIRRCYCGDFGNITLEHSNCAYVDEISNYCWCCRDCHDEINANYQDMWDEYNAGRF